MACCESIPKEDIFDSPPRVAAIKARVDPVTDAAPSVRAAGTRDDLGASVDSLLPAMASIGLGEADSPEAVPPLCAAPADASPMEQPQATSPDPSRPAFKRPGLSAAAAPVDAGPMQPVPTPSKTPGSPCASARPHDDNAMDDASLLQAAAEPLPAADADAMQIDCPDLSQSTGGRALIERESPSAILPDPVPAKACSTKPVECMAEAASIEAVRGRNQKLKFAAFWANLKALGWTYAKGSGLQEPFVFLKPGVKKKSGRLGVTMFNGEAHLEEYIDASGYAQPVDRVPDPAKPGLEASAGSRPPRGPPVRRLDLSGEAPERSPSEGEAQVLAPNAAAPEPAAVAATASAARTGFEKINAGCLEWFVPLAPADAAALATEPERGEAERQRLSAGPPRGRPSHEEEGPGTPPGTPPPEEEQEQWLLTGHHHLGRRIARSFGEDEPMFGRVTRWLPADEASGEPALFHCVHDDGERGAPAEEVLAALQTAEAAAMELERQAEGEAPVVEAEGLKLHLSSRSSTGYKGVREMESGRFYAARKDGGQDKYLGSFDSAVEAAGLKLHMSDKSATGYKGVCYEHQRGRYRAFRTEGGRTVYIGVEVRKPSEEEAAVLAATFAQDHLPRECRVALLMPDQCQTGAMRKAKEAHGSTVRGWRLQLKKRPAKEGKPDAFDMQAGERAARGALWRGDVFAPGSKKALVSTVGIKRAMGLLAQAAAVPQPAASAAGGELAAKQPPAAAKQPPQCASDAETPPEQLPGNSSPALPGGDESASQTGGEQWLLTGHHHLGRRIARSFGEDEPMFGRVTRWLPADEASGEPALFHCVHDDGERGAPAEEVLAALQTAEAAAMELGRRLGEGVAGMLSPTAPVEVRKPSEEEAAVLAATFAQDHLPRECRVALLMPDQCQTGAMRKAKEAHGSTVRGWRLQLKKRPAKEGKPDAFDMQAGERAARLCAEEHAGDLRFQVLRGGATSAAAGGGALLALLLYCDLVNAQLPSMTLKYITKLVLRSDHRSVSLESSVGSGGVTYRPFVHGEPDGGFAELTFCVVRSDTQVRGLGTRLMNHLKAQLVGLGCNSLLTYADESAAAGRALGFFLQQGFTDSVSLPAAR
ncbi:hypothetical protein EMIHUDRAFT_233966 [Emiliania huxleyi CCMP1516]|uniref:N-acetyltransferase domain-containing protein n=2 Tax=Emiliania huxleyi TaxID=2903 RepID=A0A0D3K128_EMIH1|nr:hypothetical protein EMIHUDRAFT_233966 [Emiliania huxleyi CCMP1516]EOD29463.1 hypothetical protein EMIHUDRAFT_233966 [Emiliania huxleyi CCMP1516]|eukprot:XP_005781892.1 hypothetical protein EMIHUDRAFT_233966 [Emiliania huxleyi CCMP1516]